MKALTNCERPAESVKRSPAGFLTLHEAGALPDDVNETASDQKPEGDVSINDSWSRRVDRRIGDNDTDGSVLRQSADKFETRHVAATL
ncbi:hypothetical protein MKK69_08720 [Methylobacterium sp. J-026]|uniref:hypothetical protein n=1 Tax=Methylobacterium sp. J-026 TaxID=2836624 RepID=UPI001FBA62D0|nr:hypothetical protein [Methylobacterium sp. J-026]MCJ2134141.1 hypothetical protein [Methylobacterium sp. J-026]